MLQNVSWSVGRKKDKVKVLDSITGFFEPCTLTALIGKSRFSHAIGLSHTGSHGSHSSPFFHLYFLLNGFPSFPLVPSAGASGSGKSTLLDILSKRKTQGVIEGDIYYNEHRLTSSFARDHVGYIEQSPSLIANLTCEELLLYTAALQRPSWEDAKWQKGEIQKLMKLLGLLDRKDVIVGNDMVKGLSGGETKRVTIALGMIREPMVLYMDEPTSGLDSATANEIMKLVKNIAGGNRTVISSIHSPTAFCFGLFDNLLLLSSGNIAFFGKASEVEKFFSSVGFSRDLSYTASEWLVDLLTMSESLGDITEGYKTSAQAEHNTKYVERLLAESQVPSAEVDSSGDEMDLRKQQQLEVACKKNSFFKELLALVKFRTPRNYTDGAYLGSRIGDKILFMLVIVSLYWGKGKPSDGATYASSMQVLPSVLFMVVVLPAFGSSGYMPSLMLERPIFVRERADGNYRVISYLVYKVLEEFIVSIPVSLLFCVVIYYGVGMHGSLPLFWLTFLITQNIGVVLAYLVAAFAPTVDSANAILPCYVTLCLFFVGLLIPYAEIPVYWQWFSYITFLRYSWSALMLNVSFIIITTGLRTSLVFFDKN